MILICRQTSARAHTHTHTHIHTHQIPPLEEATKEHREALQQELARVIQTSYESKDYKPIGSITHPEVATCEKAIEDMLAQEQKVQKVSKHISQLL